MAFLKGVEPLAWKDTKLFEPIKVGNVQLEHRAVMAPLSRMRAEYPGLVPNRQLALEYYDQRSKTPGTLIFTESVIPCAQAGGHDHAPGIWTKEQIDEWTKIFKRIHDNKCFVWLQLISQGRRGSPANLKRDNLRFDAPSPGVYFDENSERAAKECGNPLHGLTKDEMKQYIADYVQAARNAIGAGADGVEVHCATGFLLNQFLDPVTNKRTDEYGGTIENRIRFPLEVIDGIAEAIGWEKMGVRISPYSKFNGMSGSSDPTLLATYVLLLGELQKRANNGKPAAYVHVVEPRVSAPLADYDDIADVTGTNDYIYSVWKGVVIRAGNFTLQEAETKKALENNRSLIAYGRFYIANPDLVERLREGLPLNKYDRSTFYTHTKEGYTDYPTFEEAINWGWK
ncbi:alkene reductase KNAG_0J00330 [Huiozyma naganishii CBS 8797]|uniref:NADH:flavin oxidoreductase/NADH oxidase N-terminal domain-containing protein n=1 Tax=Huiozyma naganishii (strain ATCC MYA-139 / BCRC 22969 / CBS 8797 / KCTC 17520 / NBRC 10181 / NCYC 3082 / Yp74L-3) TaxID=1071383 RepID=J7SAF4_HUIN7|nr:hypothetical protein KNAG_0J00330 [Kazachstania naganishii CBS 8797]CCK72116.1 hypothetical protein KNAG_0J00330 [Kazachstania naganishii CBS 8797]